MSWKKNVFSYILWGIYMSAAAYSFWAYGCFFLEKMGIRGQGVPVGWGFFCAAAAGLLFVGLYFISARVKLKIASVSERKGRKGAEGALKEKNIRQMLEGLLVVAFLALGLLLRISRLELCEGTSPYYELAEVGRGQIPMEVSGGVYLYLQLLRVTFMIFGNKWMAGIWLQIMFQLLGCLLLYFAFRRIGGIFPAVLTVAYLMLTPYHVGKSLAYSPETLFLCIYAVGILIVGGYLKKQWEGTKANAFDFFSLICMGILLGGILYLDIRGISLFVLLLSVCTLEHRAEGRFWTSQAVKLGVAFFSSGIFFICCLLWNAYIRGSSFMEVWHAWFSFLQGKPLAFNFWYMKGNETVMLAITGLMVLGALGYWRFQKTERMTPWFLLLLSCCILAFFHLSGEGQEGSMMILPCLCTVSCGVGLQACVGIGIEAAGEREEAEAKAETGGRIKTGNGAKAVDGTEPRDGAKAGEKPALIENPLPLPKRKVRKNMDYAFLPDEDQMKYDIEVDDSDDFDI